MEGALDQTTRKGGRNVNRAKRTQKRDPADRRTGWMLLGASGLLQPLSEEFLYRAPDDRPGHTCRVAPVAGQKR